MKNEWQCTNFYQINNFCDVILEFSSGKLIVIIKKRYIFLFTNCKINIIYLFNIWFAEYLHFGNMNSVNLLVQRLVKHPISLKYSTSSSLNSLFKNWGTPLCEKTLTVPSFGGSLTGIMNWMNDDFLFVFSIITSINCQLFNSYS